MCEKTTPLSPSPSERFWSRVDTSGDGCWPWLGATDRSGYGHLRFDGRTHKAHRIAWRLTFGPIPAGLVIAHVCDNPPCCNPAHLFLGTRAENNADMAAKGRAARGERNRAARLTEDDVRAIRALWDAGEVTGRYLGARFGVTVATISDIVNSRRWAHVQ